MNKIQEFETRLIRIEERNQKVETDKAWESSYTRKLLLILSTYFSIALYLQFVIHIEPWLNAIVPAIGFFLSTLTLSFFKNLWTKYIYKKKNKIKNRYIV